MQSYYYANGNTSVYVNSASGTTQDGTVSLLGIAIGLPITAVFLALMLIVMCTCCLKLKKDPQGKKRVVCKKSVRTCTCCIKANKKGLHSSQPVVAGTPQFIK